MPKSQHECPHCGAGTLHIEEVTHNDRFRCSQCGHEWLTGDGKFARNMIPQLFRKKDR